MGEIENIYFFRFSSANQELRAEERGDNTEIEQRQEKRCTSPVFAALAVRIGNKLCFFVFFIEQYDFFDFQLKYRSRDFFF